MKWLQIVKHNDGIVVVYEYMQDPCADFIFHYTGCTYGWSGKSAAEIILKNAIQGVEATYFKTKPNVPHGVVFKKDMEILDL